MQALIDEAGLIWQVAEGSFEVTPPLRWIDCPAGTEAGDTYDGSRFSSPPAAPVLAEVREVPKLVVVERVGAAGKLRNARAALRMGVADDQLTDEQLLLRDRWDAAQTIRSDDEAVRALLLSVGCDPDLILA